MTGRNEKEPCSSSYHRHGHLVDLVFIFGFMLTEWTVPGISRVPQGNQSERQTYPLSNL